MTVKSCKF